MPLPNIQLNKSKYSAQCRHLLNLMAFREAGDCKSLMSPGSHECVSLLWHCRGGSILGHGTPTSLFNYFAAKFWHSVSRWTGSYSSDSFSHYTISLPSLEKKNLRKLEGTPRKGELSEVEDMSNVMAILMDIHVSSHLQATECFIQ